MCIRDRASAVLVVLHRTISFVHQLMQQGAANFTQITGKNGVKVLLPKVFESEYRFCLILWENEPIKSSELVSLCKEKLGWKPTTTYTVIKRLSERGVVKNENTVVSSLVSKDEIQEAEIDEMVEKTFEGSVPAFLAAFTKKRNLSKKEIAEIRKMIDGFEKGEEK